MTGGASHGGDPVVLSEATDPVADARTTSRVDAVAPDESVRGGSPVVGGVPPEATMTPRKRPDAPLKDIQVLLVDDYALVREVITELLEEHGAKVTAVPGAPEALEALAREPPTVLLSDIQMPGTDGYALIRTVRALPPERGGETPAAALTGLSTPLDRARALQAGFQDHMTKPVDERRLVTIVKNLAAMGQAGARGEGYRSPANMSPGLGPVPDGDPGHLRWQPPRMLGE